MSDDGRSADDLPLAAYGGSGMDLTAEDEDRISTAADPTSGGELDEVRSSDATALPGDDDDAAAAASTLDLSDEPGPSAATMARAAVLERGSQAAHLFRTSRLAAGAAFAGVILVGLLLLVGGRPGPGAASVVTSPSTPPVAIATREPGSATLVLTGKVKQELAFPGVSGAGAPDGPIAATWTDAGAASLRIEGAADRGTRATNDNLILRFTVTVKRKPVTFTSDAGECTIGMAMNPTNVSGTFSCRNLRSDDGKLVVGATGTYRT